MKKRLLALLLCAVMALPLAACGDSGSSDTGKDSAEVKQPSITKLADYSDFSAILKDKYEITDASVSAYFTSVAYSAGVALIEVKDRDTVKEGDIVVTDYVGYLNDVTFSGGSANDQWIDVKNNCGVDSTSGNATGYFIDGFTKGLVGAKIGEKTSSEVTFPKDYSNKDLAGQKTVFEFKVSKIYREITPEDLKKLTKFLQQKSSWL